MNVVLLSHSPDPIRSLYRAFRTCYSSTPPEDIDVSNADKMTRFVLARLETGHTSPLEQVTFEFAISGVSRAFSHQFVRHRVGISFEQQSQRYVTYPNGEFPFVVPPRVKDASHDAEMADLFARIADLYERMVADGVPAEDARFVLPNATATNLKVTVNLAALLHIADLRLCWRAQWEFRKVVALMRAQIVRAVPELGRFIQPKCGEHRAASCDESVKDWRACPVGRVRPHRSGASRENAGPAPLGNSEWVAIETAS